MSAVPPSNRGSQERLTVVELMVSVFAILGPFTSQRVSSASK